MLAWLSDWSEVQMICTWSSWCHCQPIVSCLIKIQFWFNLCGAGLPRLSWKRPLNGVSVCLSDVWGPTQCGWSSLRKEEVHQQACKTQIPPYTLTQRCRAQFRMPHREPIPCSSWGHIHPGSNAAAVTPREPKFTKTEKTCPDSSRTCMQNFTPLSFSTAEKSVTVQTNKQEKKANEKTYSKLDGCIVWNAHNTVLG